MKSEPKFFIGVSPYLKSDAPGHYLGVHTLYRNELSKRGIPFIYFGSKAPFQSQEEIPWVKPAVDFKPTKLINFDQIFQQFKLFKTLFLHTKRNSKIFVFDGNFNYWFIVILVCRLKRSSGHVNLIRSDLLVQNFLSEKKLFMKIALFALARLSEGYVSCSTLSSNLSKKLSLKNEFEFKRIPTLSGFVPAFNSSNKSLKVKKVLVFAPYLKDIQLLSRILIKNPSLSEQIILSTWQSEESIFKLFSNDLTIINTHLSDVEYESLISNCSHAVLLYINDFHEYGSSSKIYDCVRLGKSICVPFGTEAESQAKPCSRYYIFDGSSENEVVKAIIDPVFIGVNSPENIPSASSAFEFIFNQNLGDKKATEAFYTGAGIFVALVLFLISSPINNVARVMGKFVLFFKGNTKR